MAKNGIIKLPDGVAQTDAALAASIVEAEAPRMSLGSLVAEVLAVAATAKKVLVDLAARRVYVDAAADAALSDGGLGFAGGSVVLTRDDPTSRVSPWTVDNQLSNEGLADLTQEVLDAITEAFAQAKPSKSVSSAVNAIEDAVASVEGAPSVLVLIDQTGDGVVKVCKKVAAPGAGAVEAVIEQELEGAAPENEPLAFE